MTGLSWKRGLNKLRAIYSLKVVFGFSRTCMRPESIF